MATDLILSGTFKIGAVDCSAEVTLIIIKGTTVDVQIPATLTQPISHAGGAQKYTIQIDYLSDDASTGILFPILWTAIATPSKEVAFTALLRPGVESPTNPQWTGTFVVDGAEVGGNVGALSTGSMTCTMTGAPTILEA